MAEINMVQAINMALSRECEEDPAVVILGEDIGRNGGVFRATDGLFQRFGKDRVLDTPLSENIIMGASVGMSAAGMRPVAEIQFMGFIYPAIDQLECHASRFRNRTRGRLYCPLVLRAPYGGGVHAPEHHSESREAMLCQIPGLRVVIPSSPQRAYGLLLGAIRSDDPVVFLEPKRLYRSVTEEVEDNGLAMSLDQGVKLRNGGDVTLVSWGAMVRETLAAAEALSSRGIECDVIDLTALNPFDPAMITASVNQTGRCVVIHEASKAAGFGAEVAATVAELCFLSLIAPPVRVSAYDTVIPLARLEHAFFPGQKQISAAAEQLMEYT